MGTDWRDNDPLREPVVEIYQGDRQNYEMPDAPRSNTAEDSIGGWRPKGFVNLALEKGYKLSLRGQLRPHLHAHELLQHLRHGRHARGGAGRRSRSGTSTASTDNILADFRAGEHMMGDAFAAAAAPEFKVKLIGTAPFAKVQVIKDNEYVYSAQPNKPTVEFTWKDNSPEAGQDQLLLRARRAERRRDRLGVADVDYLREISGPGLTSRPAREAARC